MSGLLDGERNSTSDRRRYALFQRFVRLRLAFVLPQMFCPRIDQERLQKAIRGFRITETTQR